MDRLIDADALKDNMFHYAAPEMMWDRGDIEHKINEMPIIDAITVSWIEDQIAQHTSETGWTDWWGDMCRRFLQEYERRRDDGTVD